jgi:hypothetical protein
MTPENFCYWLQGVFEIQMAGLDYNEVRVPQLNEAQMMMIQRHLQSVFTARVQPEVAKFISEASSIYPLIDPTKGPTATIC